MLPAITLRCAPSDRLPGSSCPTREGMGSDTAMQPTIQACPRQWDRIDAAQACYSGSRQEVPQDPIPTGLHPVGRHLEAERPAFPLLTGWFVGLAGLEPAPSS
jgi:hypothetical protein